MIRGQDILSKYPNAEIQSISKGYVTKCNSPSGVCYDLLDTQYANDGQVKGDFPKRKAKSKFYFVYTSTKYRDIESMGGEFSRTEYYLQDGTPVYINDCHSGHGHCNHIEVLKVVELFNSYRSQNVYRKIRIDHTKAKRKPVKKVKHVTKKVKRVTKKK